MQIADLVFIRILNFLDCAIGISKQKLTHILFLKSENEQDS